MTALGKLLSNSSSPLSDHKPEISAQSRRLAGALVDPLLGVLYQRNGFYSLERALHFFPTHSSLSEIGICDWNENSLWRDRYKNLANDCVFFAEDAFGGQFCIKDSRVYIFDPETGSLEYLADDIGGWAQAIVNDYEALTGYPLAHQWQIKNGQIPAGKRLLPKLPFILGGEFEIDNLYLADAVKGMISRANIANQIKDFPDGTKIKFNVVN